MIRARVLYRLTGQQDTARYTRCSSKKTAAKSDAKQFIDLRFDAIARAAVRCARPVRDMRRVNATCMVAASRIIGRITEPQITARSR
jgi:hypothetical protein